MELNPHDWKPASILLLTWPPAGVSQFESARRKEPVHFRARIPLDFPLAQQEWIGRAVLFGEIERVDDVMPALPEPESESARRLGIDLELHAARG